ncbi:MAG: glycosyltransferase family 2 protein [Bacteroidaceae bacterium]|nr:glycosyltransferase family 2 protein [Bacteroidaceae bacterium]
MESRYFEGESEKLKVSVVIPSYCPQNYTLECLESLRQQTLAPEKFEVLVILNGPREPYYEFLNKAMLDNGRLLYSSVASACSSRNMGIDNAKGEYICFIDDDDRISPTYLEELLALARPDVVSASNFLSFYDDGHVEDHPRYSREYQRFAPLGEQPYYRPKKIFSGPWMKMIHRDIIGERRFDVSFPSGQDALLMFTMSDRMKKVCFTSPHAIYYRRERAQSLHRLGRWGLVRKYSRLAWAYTRIYLRHPRDYNFGFYFTRLLASCHGMVAKT